MMQGGVDDVGVDVQSKNRYEVYAESVPKNSERQHREDQNRSMPVGPQRDVSRHQAQNKQYKTRPYSTAFLRHPDRQSRQQTDLPFPQIGFPKHPEQQMGCICRKPLQHPLKSRLQSAEDRHHEDQKANRENHDPHHA